MAFFPAPHLAYHFLTKGWGWQIRQVVGLCKSHQVPELQVRGSLTSNPAPPCLLFASNPFQPLHLVKLPQLHIPAPTPTPGKPSLTAVALWVCLLFLEATPHNAALTFLMIFIPSYLFYASFFFFFFFLSEGMVQVYTSPGFLKTSSLELTSRMKFSKCLFRA